MGFKFRYEALLSHRRHLKEKAEIELSLAQRHLRQSMDSLENYRSNLTQANLALGTSLRGRIPAHDLKNHSDYLAGLKDNIGAKELELVELKKNVEAKMEILLEKTKQYKGMERLKERDDEKWNDQQRLMEQKVMKE